MSLATLPAAFFGLDALAADRTGRRRSLNAMPRGGRASAPVGPAYQGLTAMPQLDPLHAKGESTSLDGIYLRLLEEQQRTEQLHHALTVAHAALEQANAALQKTREGQRHALHLANHDALTGVLNRRAFMAHLTQSMENFASGTSFLSVLFIDLDHFKLINDQHGHAMGDWVLQVVASRLTQAVRANDVVARLGGDEFVCLLGDTPTMEQVGRVAGKLFDAIAEPIQLGALHLQVLPSIGIATFSQGEPLDTAQLLKQADHAMYQAKRHQCRFVFYTPDDVCESA